MAKRKITVTVDEELLERAHQLGAKTISGVVNQALSSHLEQLGRQAALRQLLDRWDTEQGPISEAAAAEARAAFDELDAMESHEGVA